jgi:hypothetical protein
MNYQATNYQVTKKPSPGQILSPQDRRNMSRADGIYSATPGADGTYLYVISRSTFKSFFRKGWVVDDVFSDNKSLLTHKPRRLRRIDETLITLYSDRETPIFRSRNQGHPHRSQGL